MENCGKSERQFFTAALKFRPFHQLQTSISRECVFSRALPETPRMRFEISRVRRPQHLTLDDFQVDRSR